ncbi:MAG: PIN domain-containing protein [Deltaproteobacteria bacterium]|nr:PIN domain-containing protein [Deltaproteobacteria bacterium]
MENERVFVDTSAFYALMDRSDNNYEKAAGVWASLLEKDLYLFTGNYVIVETMALLQSRLGFEAANLWYRDVLSLAEILWTDGAIHNLAYELWLSLGRHKLSFVDCVSFATMRHYKIEKVFGFDRHFEEQGFEIS